MRLAARGLVGAKGETDARIGEAMAQELDQMKGMAMKVGQILSYFDGVLPPETHAALQKLQQGSIPVEFETMRAVIEESFGASLDGLFDEFDPDPVASASIGQVYRAVFNKKPVAVKVQYPGVAETIDSNFAKIGKIASIASLVSAVDGKAIAQEMRERIGEECNYLNEAVHQDAFADAFEEDADVHIPLSIRERTTRDVITTEWCSGRDFYTYAHEADQEHRNRSAMVLARFAHTSLFGLGTLNADPHPGNYLFPEDGPVIFLDFGCVHRFDPEYIENERNLARVVLEDRRSDFEDVVIPTGIVADYEKFDFDTHWRMMCHQYEPYRSDTFKFTFDYIKRGTEFSGPGNPNGRIMAIPPEWIWITRLQWGLSAVLARLGAEGAFRPILLKALDMSLEPLIEQS